MKAAFIGNGNVKIDIWNDQLTSDNGVAVANVPLYQWAAGQQGWGISEDMCGHKCLTIENFDIGRPYYIEVLTVNNVTERYNVCELIGGRPPVTR